MRNKKRLMAVYKGDEHIVTGTAEQVAEYLGISEESAIYLTRPVNHRRNKGGKRKIAFYVDDSPLADKIHDFLITACRLYEKHQRPLELIETGVEAGYNHTSASSVASKRYRDLAEYGYVERVDDPIVLYVPTTLGMEYYNEFELEDAQ